MNVKGHKTVKCLHCLKNTTGLKGNPDYCGHCRKPTGTKTAKPLDHTDQRILDLERELDRAKETSRIFGDKLKKSRKAEDLFIDAAAVIRAHTVPLRPIASTPTVVKDGAADCDLVLLLSDEHADQQITAAGTWGLERYDFNVFRCRLDRLKRQTINYAVKHLPRHEFRRLWILKLGDSVNGDIHGKGPKNFFGNTIKAALSVGDAEAQFVQSLIPHFSGGVHVVSVAGNHPRRSMRKDYEGPNDNFDYLVSTQMATRLQREIDAGRASVHIPDAWTAFVEIRGRVWALNHGDDVIGFAGIPWYGFERKNNRVQNLTARFDQKISYFCYGHFHTPMSFPSGGGESIHSGAWPMTDPYAINKLSAGNEPRQTLYAVDDELGVILTIPIFTRNAEKESRCLAGEYEPEIGNRLIIDSVTTDRDVGEFPLYRAPDAA